MLLAPHDRLLATFFMKKPTVMVRTYYVLPCCLLLLNLVNNVISYKTEMIQDPYLRVAVIMALVLFGGSLVAFLVAPGLEKLVRTLHRSSKAGGYIGEIVFLTMLGVAVFWLYYASYIHGPQSILPPGWENG